MMPSVKITVLMENSSSRNDLKTEHGLSLWIEADGLRLLFDTGQSAAFLTNAERLGVPISTADAVVLSHGHYDHTGGLAFLTGAQEPRKIYLHPQALCTRFSRQEHPPHRGIGIPAGSAALLGRLVNRVVLTTIPTRISGRIGVTGPIPRKTRFEDVGGPFFLDPECSRPDPIPDDQAMWIETESGIVVLLGCGHAGVVNTLDYVAQLTRVERFRAVIGGLHLLNADENRMVNTVEALRRYDVKLLALGHCTGDSAIERLTRGCSAVVHRLSTGTTLEL